MCNVDAHFIDIYRKRKPEYRVGMFLENTCKISQIDKLYVTKL